MGLFAFGFLGGSLAALAWVYLRQRREPFEKHLHRELALSEQPGRPPESPEKATGSFQPQGDASPLSGHCSLTGIEGDCRMQTSGSTPGRRQTSAAQKMRVLELLGQGYPCEQILRETRLGKGAVDLILTMREKGML